MLDTVNKADREQVRIVIADHDRHLRSNLRQAMLFAGFKTVVDIASVASLRPLLEEAQPDLLLIAARFPDGDGISLVRELRHNRCGRNPFLSVIITAWPEEVDDVGRLINSGTDHVVLKPVAPKAIFERMEAMIERRKPFVATSAYLGPDRRKAPRADEERIPTFEVPNTLRQRAKGKPVDLRELQRQIDSALGKLHSEMARRQAFHIAFLVERAAPLLETGGDAAGLLTEIDAAAQDLVRRLDARSHGHVGELCASMHRHIASAAERDAGARWSADDILVLRKLSLAIYVGLHQGSSVADLAIKVAQAVEAFERRRHGRPAANLQPQIIN